MHFLGHYFKNSFLGYKTNGFIALCLLILQKSSPRALPVFICPIEKSTAVGHFSHAKVLAVGSYSRLLGARAPDPDARLARRYACRARGSDSVSISMRAHALPLASIWTLAGCLPASQPFQLSLSYMHDRFCKQPRSFFILCMAVFWMDLI